MALFFLAGIFKTANHCMIFPLSSFPTEMWGLCRQKLFVWFTTLIFESDLLYLLNVWIVLPLSLKFNNLSKISQCQLLCISFYSPWENILAFILADSGLYLEKIHFCYIFKFLFFPLPLAEFSNWGTWLIQRFLRATDELSLCWRL